MSESRRKKSTKQAKKTAKKKAGSSRSSTYQTQPSMPASVARRVNMVNAILAEEITVSEGARQLGISRVQMQSLKNRAMAAMAEALTPQKGGRPPKDEVEELEEELDHLESLNEELKTELSKNSNVVLELTKMVREQESKIRGLERQLHGRPRRSRRRRKSDDDDSKARIRMARAGRLVELGAPRSVAARAVSTSVSTLRRWQRQSRQAKLLVHRRGPGPRQPPTPKQREEAEERVRELNGAIGAAALGKAAGISRREAARIKREMLTKLERERKADARRVEIAAPGIVRSLDAMHFEALDGKVYGLFMADGAVAHRTSAQLVECYDSRAVEQVIGADFDEHGAPLVLRLDRASCQRTPTVRALLRDHGVLHLHGPPRHAQYYGQLERQNREHRQILGRGKMPKAVLAARLGPMCHALNHRWPRRSLGWRTTGELWDARRPITLDRDQLREQVIERAARIQNASSKDLDQELVWRLAIEHALIQHGLLRITPGGGC